MKRLIKIAILIIILIFLGSYFVRNNERINIDSATVYIKKTGSNYELYRNGKPFYIQGASGDSYMEELKDAGANTFRVYDTINLRTTLDKAKDLNLAVIVDLMLPKFKGNEKYYKDLKVREELNKSIFNVVENNKDHPALLMWNFNEIEYPHKLKHKYFRTFFGGIIDKIHQIDMNHPVSTSVTGSNKKQIASLKLWCPELDLISINIFGGLTYLKYEFYKLSLIWDGPYYLSEWGSNGPWEESRKTSWGAPIEMSSTQKSKELRNRYNAFMPKKDDDRCLGNLVFFWGQKQERTHTWFSLFSETGEKSKMVQDLTSIWSDSLPKNNAPNITKVSINNRFAGNNIVLDFEQNITASVSYTDVDNDSLTIKWELYPENWAYFFGSKETKPEKISNAIIEIKNNHIVLNAPKKEGPYRLFAYVYDDMGNFATSNIPFYVLKSEK